MRAQSQHVKVKSVALLVFRLIITPKTEKRRNMLKRKRFIVIGVIAVLALLSTLGYSLVKARPIQQESPPASESTVSVSGTGQVQAAPDRAVIRLGVETEAETAENALAQNSTQMQALLDALSAAGIASENIQTQSVRLMPRYQFGDERDDRTLVGFAAANFVRVQTDQLDSLGVLLDEAVSAGATTIENVSFAVSDQTEFVDQARQAAVEDARYKAEQLAELTGAELGAVLQINESSDVPRPVRREAEVMEEAAAVPIEPGTESIRVSVQITWTLIAGE
jgi:hypothetical protein